MPRAVMFDEFGGPEVLHLAEVPAAEPGPGEVRVRIEAFAVNPLDAMMRSGTSPAPVPLPHARLGIEATGTVDALGPGVTGRTPGEPVILTAVPDPVTAGTYAEYAVVPADRLVPRPPGLGITEAAALWVGHSTAYGALVEKAGMRPGDHVLITAASGAVGGAAMQIARQIGAVPLAVTRHAAKEDELLAAGAEAVVATDREEIAEAVVRLTGGRGADVVLDLVMGPGQPELLRAVRPGGSLIGAGFLDPRPTPFPRGASLTIHSYRGFDLLLDPEAAARTAAFLAAGVRLGALRPAVGPVFALDETAEAHRALEAGAPGGGKIVVTVP